LTSRTRGATTRRGIWNLADQVVSSLSNGAVTVLVARTVSATEFGWFAVAFTTSLLLLSVVREIVSQPFLLESSALTAEPFREQARAAAGAVVVFGTVLGLGVVAGGVAVQGSGGAGLVMAGITLPGLFLQDLLRFVGLARGRPQDAALNDTVWLVALAVVLGALISADVRAGWAYILAWGATAAAAAGVAAIRAGVLPRPFGALRWTWTRRGTSGWLVLELAAAYGSVQVVILLVGGVAGAAAAGAWRGTQTLLGPVNVLGMAALSFLVPELLRRPDLSHGRRIRAAAALSGVLVVANVTYGAVLLALPEAAGEQVLGATWASARAYLLPLTVWSAAVAMSLGPLSVLQTLGRIRAAAGVSIRLLPVLLTAAAVGLLLGGGRGAAYGVMLAQLAIVPVWWQVLLRAVREAGGAVTPDSPAIPFLDD